MSVPFLQIQGITKRYAQHTALDHVSFDVKQGAVLGLLGPNGAGKTSLIRILTQITAPDEGMVLLNGSAIKPADVERMGYLPEERGLYKKMEVGEQLIYMGRLKGLSRTDVMARLKVWVDKFEIRDWWKKKIEELSKGMQQKVQFIATVLHQPDFLILDEPFTGFDPVNAMLIRDEILNLNKQGTTILFSTHRMESVEQLCSDLVMIHKSKVVLEGTPRQIRNRYRTMEFIAELDHFNPEAFKHELISSEEPIPGRTKLHIRWHADESPNALIQSLLQAGTLVHFEESIPGLDQIFVKVVEG